MVFYDPGQRHIDGQGRRGNQKRRDRNVTHQCSDPAEHAVVVVGRLKEQAAVGITVGLFERFAEVFNPVCGFVPTSGNEQPQRGQTRCQGCKATDFLLRPHVKHFSGEETSSWKTYAQPAGAVQ